MFEKIIPLFYWPSKVLMVDDEAQFLKSAVDLLSHQFSVEGHEAPQKAIDLIQTAEQTNLVDDFFSTSNDPDDDNDAVTIIRNDWNNILLNAYKENRYNLISVLVMDYNLPQNNGLYYVNQLNITNSFVQTLLLTGYAKPEEVIQAFNQGKIKKYINKSSENAQELLMTTVQELQYDYFSNLSYEHIQAKTDLYKIITNPNFIVFFKEILSKYKVEEFYLLDAYGSYLMKDNAGKSFILAVCNSDHLTGHDMLFEGQTEMPQSLADSIVAKTKMPFFFRDKFPEGGLANWPPYCFPCHPIDNTDWHYALIFDFEIYDIQPIS